MNKHLHVIWLTHKHKHLSSLMGSDECSLKILAPIKLSYLSSVVWFDTMFSMSVNLSFKLFFITNTFLLTVFSQYFSNQMMFFVGQWNMSFYPFSLQQTVSYSLVMGVQIRIGSIRCPIFTLIGWAENWRKWLNFVHDVTTHSGWIWGHT